MKITLDIPSETIGAFWNFIRFDDGSYRMGTYSIGSNDLYDGNTIFIEPVKPQEENNG